MWKATRHTQNWASKQPCLSNIQKSDGNYVAKPEKNIKELKKILLPAPHSEDLSNISNFQYPNDLLLPQITKKEILQIGKYLQMKKALGLDQILIKVLKVIMPKISDHLVQIFHDSFSIGNYPAHFKESVIIIICKQKSERDYTSPKSYWPISLLNT